MAGFTTLNAAPQSRPVLVPPVKPEVLEARTRFMRAFNGDSALLSKVGTLLEEQRDLEPLFEEISTYILSLREQITQQSNGSHIQAQIQATDAQPTKKRKLEAPSDATSNAGWADRSSKPDFTAPDVSFSIPVRKKLRLECISSKTGGIRGVNTTSGDLEFGQSWENVDSAFCLPLPEKAKKQHNFVIIPKGGEEPVVWTVNETAASEGETDAEPARTARYLSSQLARFDREVVLPDENEFVSAMANVRKGEKAYHVKAHRGSKEGYLFLLSQGIFWGFKKPLLYMPFSSITSTSYTSVLQRTFNLTVSLSPTPSQANGNTSNKDSDTEVEFAMIDQAEFAGIDAYIKGHGLNDASLAEQRKAKVYGVNKVKDEEINGNGAQTGGDDGLLEGETELQKAERMLQDAEDDEEEDYVDEEGEEGSSEEEDYEEGAYDEEGGNEMEEDEEE